MGLPQTLSLGVEHRLKPELRLFAELQWGEWSRFKGFEIAFASGPNELSPIEWEDTWLGAVGFGYRVQPNTEIISSISSDTAAFRWQ